MDKFVTLVEQVILLLGQASLSVSYIRRVNILKMIMKDPRKANTMLKENENVLRDYKTHLFGKKFGSHMIEKAYYRCWREKVSLSKKIFLQSQQTA